MGKEPGLSILDIAPQHDTVQVGNQELKVYGIAADGVVTLFRRFPEMQAWFKGGKVNLTELIVKAPDAIAAVIAAGCGEPGNEQAEATAKRFGVETQLDCLEKIVKLTFKDGFGPFAERIVALSESLRSANFGRVPVTKSQPESST
jgi:hypothetical protein